jgi:ATP phosphoribosyltransferase regulatory subunit HisZ
VKRWLHLVAYAVRCRRARRVHRQSIERAKRLREEYTLVGAELLHALRAKADAEVHLTETIRQK